jgi:hypothetical protein
LNMCWSLILMTLTLDPVNVGLEKSGLTALQTPLNVDNYFRESSLIK